MRALTLLSGPGALEADAIRCGRFPHNRIGDEACVWALWRFNYGRAMDDRSVQQRLVCKVSRVGLMVDLVVTVVHRVNTPLTAENEGQISQVSAHWVLDMLYGDI